MLYWNSIRMLFECKELKKILTKRDDNREPHSAAAKNKLTLENLNNAYKYTNF